MVNPGDFFSRNTVNGLEKLLRLMAHHHHPVRELGDAFGDGHLALRRPLNHRVQGGHQGHAQAAEQVQDMDAVIPAENPEFVLEANHLHPVHVQKVRRQPVLGQNPLVDLETYLAGISIPLGNIVHHHSKMISAGVFLGKGRQQICGEGGDAALARQEIADQRDFSWAGWMIAGFKHVNSPLPCFGM